MRAGVDELGRIKSPRLKVGNANAVLQQSCALNRPSREGCNYLCKAARQEIITTLWLKAPSENNAKC